mmetsp:Transcript_37331/g.64769  ORF Transcript_37331/g.64769 Transcript_37331/m.64769 type:complete len:256 (+) Transcript_37331:42-809(+)
MTRRRISEGQDGPRKPSSDKFEELFQDKPIEITSRNIRETEDYMNLVSKLLYPQAPLEKYAKPETQELVINQVSLLGMLMSPVRKPTVIEKWSPFEVACFEAAIALFGKDFHRIQKWVRSKGTKELVEFYYVWKKTSRYPHWKRSYARFAGAGAAEDGDGEPTSGHAAASPGGDDGEAETGARQSGPQNGAANAAEDEGALVGPGKGEEEDGGVAEEKGEGPRIWKGQGNAGNGRKGGSSAGTEGGKKKRRRSRV